MHSPGKEGGRPVLPAQGPTGSPATPTAADYQKHGGTYHTKSNDIQQRTTSRYAD